MQDAEFISHIIDASSLDDFPPGASSINFICNMNIRAHNQFYLADQIQNILIDVFSSEYFGQIWIGRPVLTGNY